MLNKNIDALSAKIATVLGDGISTFPFDPESSEKVGVSNRLSKLTLKKVLRFTKIEHTAFSLPLLFAGAWIGADYKMPPLHLLLLIIIAAIGARVFGMAFNRIFDRKIDALNPRTAVRELPSGTMKISHAYYIAGSGFLVYLTACILLGGYCLLLFPVPLIPLLGYSLLKRFTAYCHFGIGLCLSLAPVGAFIAISGELNFTLPLMLFSGFVFLWMSASDIIYAIMDIESDRRHQVYSLPAGLGRDKAQKVAGTVHFFSFVFLLMIVMVLKGGPYAWVMTGYTAVMLSLMYHPSIPLPVRFFPISTLAGVSGALIPVMIG